MSVTKCKRLPTINDIVETTESHLPVFCIRPATLKSTAECFVSSFKQGDVLYAVKCNTDAAVLDILWRSGVRHFDCASLRECMIIRSRFGSAAGVHFLHPIKSRQDIIKAHTKYAVKTFTVDSVRELEKIFNVLGEEGQDLTLIVRLTIPSHHSNPDQGKQEEGIRYPLSGKYGVDRMDEAVELLGQARHRAHRLGVSFHIGSQCTDPIHYARALDYVNKVLNQANVSVEIIDVGGGFPIQYEPHTTLPPLQTYFEMIENGFQALSKRLTSNARLWCEPGRALVAASGSLIIRVEDRRCKPNTSVLYINDGVFGHLYDASAHIHWSFPVRMIRHSTAELMPFAFYGPTCDSMDYMPGPFLLPSDIQVGDYIEIGQLGAYSSCFRTRLNGFGSRVTAFVCDEPMLQTPGHIED